MLSERLRSARPGKQEPPGHAPSLPRGAPPPVRRVGPSRVTLTGRKSVRVSGGPPPDAHLLAGDRTTPDADDADRRHRARAPPDAAAAPTTATTNDSVAEGEASRATGVALSGAASPAGTPTDRVGCRGPRRPGDGCDRTPASPRASAWFDTRPPRSSSSTRLLNADRWWRACVPAAARRVPAERVSSGGAPPSPRAERVGNLVLHARRRTAGDRAVPVRRRRVLAGRLPAALRRHAGPAAVPGAPTPREHVAGRLIGALGYGRGRVGVHHRPQ